MIHPTSAVDEDIDGVPLDADGSGPGRAGGTFVPSRWESVQPDADDARAPPDDDTPAPTTPASQQLHDK